MRDKYSPLFISIVWIVLMLSFPASSFSRESIEELKKAAWEHTQQAKGLTPSLVAANAEKLIQEEWWTPITPSSGGMLIAGKDRSEYSQTTTVMRSTEGIEKSLAIQKDQNAKLASKMARENFSDIFSEFQREFCLKPPIEDKEIQDMKYEAYGALFFIAYSIVANHTTPDPRLVGLVAARISGLAIAMLVNSGRERFCSMPYPLTK